MNPRKKPVLGVMPRRIWDESRRNDLIGAIQRYLDAGKPIPPEWVEEYNELARREDGI